MTDPICVVNTTKYEALRLNSAEAEKKVLEWLAPTLKVGEVAKLNTLRRLGVWALRHPSGSVSFVHPDEFSRDFKAVFPISETTFTAEEHAEFAANIS